MCIQCFSRRARRVCAHLQTTTPTESRPGWSVNGILYKASESTNGGVIRLVKSTTSPYNSWSRADFALPDVPISDIAVDPSDTSGNTVYAATWIGVYRTNVWAQGLYLSEDGKLLHAATYGRRLGDLAVTVSRRFASVWTSGRMACFCFC
jgi:hypothetical protein